MRYLSHDEFKKISTIILTDEAFEQKELNASRDIDALTFNRIKFDDLTAFQKSLVKEAVALQLEFTHVYGDLINSPINSYSAGGTSVSYDRRSITVVNGVSTCDLVVGRLKQTGLMVRVL